MTSPLNIHRIRVLACASLITLAGCGGGSAGGASASGGPIVVIPTSSPTPTPTATPAPTPTPTATPTPTPTPTSVGGSVPLNGLLFEGDSQSIFWTGNHTGVYAAAHAGLTVFGKAIGGSTLDDMIARFDVDVVSRPRVVFIYIGTNGVYDIGAAGGKYQTVDQWLNALYAYAAKWRTVGARVVIATVLGRCEAGNPNNVNTRQNSLRIPVNTGLRGAVGTKLDGLVDYAADPVMGTDAAACDKSLFVDGVHSTDGYSFGSGGQGKMAAIDAPVLDQQLAAGAIAGN